VSIEGLLSAVVVGLVLGALGRLVVPGRQPIGCLLTIVVGILAAILGGVVADAAGIGGGDGGFDWAVFGIQVLVAAVGVAVVGGLARRS
jgi:uncharacterized membrane protein YeaQ/YmgE (transglycosylase-associated protein family)